MNWTWGRIRKDLAAHGHGPTRAIDVRAACGRTLPSWGVDQSDEMPVHKVCKSCLKAFARAHGE